MARRKKKRAGLLRRYTFKLTPTPDQEVALIRDCRMVAALWNGCLQRNDDSYRRIAMARHEWVWSPYSPPRKNRRGEIIEGRYVRRHLAHAQREHSDPNGEKLKLKTNLRLFDLTPEITQVRRELPEYAEQSKYSQLRVAKALEEAFAAFFRRLREGAEEPGYPNYRATARADWLPHMFRSGCRLTPSAGPHKDSNPVRRWRLKLKGVPGLIRASGEFPARPVAWLDADIRHRGGAWWLSVCVEIENRRGGSQHQPAIPPLKPQPRCGSGHAEVRFDLVDTFAQVKGEVAPPPSWSDILALQEQLDALKTERDTRYPRRAGQRPSHSSRRMSERIGKLSARIARMRRERLHQWTTAVVAQSSDLTIVAPLIKESTRSAKGDEKNWGAAVDAVAGLNRHVLSQAPASALHMLRYKAEEAGVRVRLKEDAKPPVAIGRGLSEATKAVRLARRALRKAEHGHKPGNERTRGHHHGRNATGKGSAGA